MTLLLEYMATTLTLPLHPLHPMASQNEQVMALQGHQPALQIIQLYAHLNEGDTTNSHPSQLLQFYELMDFRN